MKFSYLQVLCDDKGLAPVVVGQPNDHLMNWSGCNYHWVFLPGWKRGRRLEDTSENRRQLEALCSAVNTKRLQVWISPMVGSFLSDRDSRF